MTNRLLETKFHIPARRTGDVPRPRLLEILQTGLSENRKLTLISAPAGYGKTTLITDWIHSVTDDYRVTWLSLDEGDNETTRFMGYWISTFGHIDELLGQDAESMLGMAQVLSPTAIMDTLINKLVSSETPMVVVLDDYHIITNPTVHESLEYFVEHQPSHVHLVITSREDPPLPIARMRARRQITEIRAHDLRFSLEEAGQFFNQSMKLDLTLESVNALEKRTEGWAVGLQLAALALQSLPDPQEFIETFRGSHRYILDYLAEEVLRLQSGDIRLFLARTSVLERLNALLCNALTGRDDSQALLTQLEQSNLFIVPLDNERVWYRYHHLFADYLKTELTKSEMTALYKKAAVWHAEKDLVVEAVKYALASHDPGFAADMVEQALNNDATWSGGNLSLLSSWLDTLPPQVFQSRPQLSLHSSRILYLSGRFELAEKRIAEAEQVLRSPLATSDPQREQMLALAALYRGAIASVRGDAQQAIEQTTYAQSRLPRENHLAHARAFFSLGLAYEITDQNDRAAQSYLQSSDEAKSAGVLFLAIHGRCAAAQVQIKQGRLHLAEQTCQQIIQFAEGARIAPLGLAFSILGGIALERNDLTSAERLLQDGIALSRQGGLMDDVISGLAFLTRLHAYQGSTTSALAAIQEVKSIIQEYGIQRMSMLVVAYTARLQLYLGQKQAATQWVSEYQSIRTVPAREFEDMVLARVLLANGELEAVPPILNPLIEMAISGGRNQICIEAMILLSLYHQAKKETQIAVDWLGKALQLAAPEGFIRVFLDEGKPLLDLLTKAHQSAPELVDSILGMSQPMGDTHSDPSAQLSDPLSPQELRVLKLILAGKSNQEIAAELVISTGTAKWHVHNILQKLGVGNRPQAIVRARELGIE